MTCNQSSRGDPNSVLGDALFFGPHTLSDHRLNLTTIGEGRIAVVLSRLGLSRCREMHVWIVEQQEEGRRMSLFRIVHARCAIPNEVGGDNEVGGEGRKGGEGGKGRFRFTRSFKIMKRVRQFDYAQEEEEEDQRRISCSGNEQVRETMTTAARKNKNRGNAANHSRCIRLCICIHKVLGGAFDK